MNKIKAKPIVRGESTGELLIFKSSFSFLGDVDMDTSEIIVKGHEHEGKYLKGKIILLPDSKGSSGGCTVLDVLARQNAAPAGIIVKKMVDTNLTEGAILANVPVVCVPEKDPEECFKNGQKISINGTTGEIYD